MMVLKYKIFLLIPLSILIGCISSFQPQYKKIDNARLEYIKGNDEKYQEILKAFRKGDEYSGNAAIVLGKLADRRATQDLCNELLRDGSYARESLKALGMILDPRSVPVLIRVVKEDRPYAKEAVEIISKLKDRRAVPTLIQVIRDRRPYYLSAFNALGEINDDRVIPYLLEFLEKPTPEEPPDLRLRVIHSSKDEPTWKHTRTFQYSGSNIPPRIEIIDYGIDPIGVVWIHYQIFDNDLDSMTIVPEFSIDEGNSWSNAQVEGRTDDISSELYEGELYWRADKENIPYSQQTKLVFKLTPFEKNKAISDGIYDVIAIDVNYDEIDIKDIYIQSRDNITFSVYYPRELAETEDIFNYMYSLNGGKNWIKATAQRLLQTETVTPDTERVVWKSYEDLPAFDSDNVSFLVSLSGGKTFGKWVATAPFHLDNNREPSARMLSINDAELLEIEYQINDLEGDTIALVAEFSQNGGISWEKATISGDISKLIPANYTGILKWYSNFDIPGLKNKPIRIKLTPYDKDQGNPDETRDFYLKPSYYAKPVSGLSPNDISLKYYNTKSDSTVPNIQFSSNAGASWKNATAKSFPGAAELDRYTNIINWETDEDVVLPRRRIRTFSKILNQLEEPSIVPELLIISRQKNSPNYLERRNALQVIETLNEKPKWVVDGLINSLLDESTIVRDMAQSYLRPIDETRVKEALAAYDNYWNERLRAEKETLASEEESIFYAQEIETLKSYQPTKLELTDFIKRQFKAQDIREDRAEDFMAELELFKIEKLLKARLDNGTITKEEYNNMLREETRKYELEKLDRDKYK